MTEGTTAPEVAELQADIESTREDLSRTVDMLTARLDVKTRVRGRLRQVRDEAQRRLRAAGRRAREDAAQADARRVSIGAGALAAAAVAVSAVALWRRHQGSGRRSRRR